MKDDLILRLLEETCKGLEGVNFPVTTPHLMLSYQALVGAAVANHPENEFLRTLQFIGDDGDSKRKDGIAYAFQSGGQGENSGDETRFHFSRRGSRHQSGPEEMRILFAQLRLVLESLQESREPPRY